MTQETNKPTIPATLFKIFFRNKAFEIQRDIQDLRETFVKMFYSPVYDEQCLIERQLTIVTLETRRLIELIDRANESRMLNNLTQQFNEQEPSK